MARLAKSLAVLRDELDEHAPDRSKVSDGWLGDAAHQKTKSDHNPNAAGVVRALDVTNDPKGGLAGASLATLLYRQLGKHPALGSGAYVIYNRRIVSTDRLAEGWRPYDGLNAHVSHVHVSVATRASGYDSVKPWNLWPDAPTRVSRARALLVEAAEHSGPVRRAAIRAALRLLPKR